MTLPPLVVTALRVAFVVALAVVLWLLLTPQPPGPEGNDKVEHLATFAGLAALGWAARMPWRWLAPGLVAYAVLTEVMQATLTTSRHGDPRDALADTVGVLVVLLLTWLLGRRRGTP